MKVTEKQKLEAIAAKYYDHFPWTPKLHDYYTLTRNSFGLELFQITHETETQFGIMKIWDEYGGFQDEPTWFDKQGFTTDGFGPNRVYIPEWVLKA